MTLPGQGAPRERSYTSAERHAVAAAALMDLDTLLVGLRAAAARSGQVGVSTIMPSVRALAEALPVLREILAEHDSEKAEVADSAYGKGLRWTVAVAGPTTTRQREENRRLIAQLKAERAARPEEVVVLRREVAELRDALARATWRAERAERQEATP